MVLWFWLRAAPWFYYHIVSRWYSILTGQGRVSPGSACLRKANGMNMLGRGKNLGFLGQEVRGESDSQERMVLAVCLSKPCAGISTMWCRHLHRHTKDFYLKMMVMSSFPCLPNFIGSGTFSSYESSIFFSMSTRFHRVKAEMSWNKQKTFWKKINLIFSDFTFFTF